MLVLQYKVLYCSRSSDLYPVFFVIQFVIINFIMLMTDTLFDGEGEEKKLNLDHGCQLQRLDLTYFIHWRHTTLQLEFIFIVCDTQQ